ncbi:hypothetical protein HU715_015795 [Pseudomonas sp. SWRI12]|uniref:Uncharacterized protein n=1 Tax=Pseudomonas zanjanensis TaxID=2745496 RepID=A0A923JNN2_9PSED|nr:MULTISPECIES: hypothetical protein [Pseudomonas]MBC3383556.1 hypothetical protein [Pseudomonas sp. SWRI179]MBV4496816.1 hypothetical protein [Pseudomonas zanjanensis]
MNNFKHYLPILLLSLISSSGTANENISNTKDTSNALGQIEVIEGDGIHKCSIPALDGEYVVSKHGCTNDQAYNVRFINVPSALRITFLDDKWTSTCKWSAGWEIEVRTIKNPTTTDPMSLDTMFNAPAGQIIEPGVLKTRHSGGGTVGGHLSCIEVKSGT